MYVVLGIHVMHGCWWLAIASRPIFLISHKQIKQDGKEYHQPAIEVHIH